MTDPKFNLSIGGSLVLTHGFIKGTVRFRPRNDQFSANFRKSRNCAEAYWWSGLGWNWIAHKLKQRVIGMSVSK